MLDVTRFVFGFWTSPSWHERPINVHILNERHINKNYVNKRKCDYDTGHLMLQPLLRDEAIQVVALFRIRDQGSGETKTHVISIVANYLEMMIKNKILSGLHSDLNSDGRSKNKTNLF